MKNPIVTITTSQGQIVLELYPQAAPNTVRCFLWLARRELFDDRQIRRIAPGFVLQPSYSDFDDPRCAVTLRGEYETAGFPNPIRFHRGTVAMGGEGDIASGSCFFITLTDEAGAQLQGNFAAFGQVLSGWEEIERIVSVPSRRVNIPDAPGVVVYEPCSPEYLVRVEVQTFGESYPAPELLAGSLSIRKTALSDLPRVMDIYAHARRFMAEHGNPNQWGPTCWPPEALIRTDIAAGKSFVCTEPGGRIVGTFFYDWGQDIEPTYRVIDGGWAKNEPYGVVHRIASSGDRKGVGAFCISWALEQCGNLRMDTHGDNVVMQRLLEKLGFQKRGIIHVIEDPFPRIAYEK